MRKTVFRSLGLAVLLATSGVVLACEDEGPAEEIGEAADEAADDVEDAID